MRFLIMSPRFPRQHAHSDDLFALLGQPGTKWPAEGLPERLVQGIPVWVTPSVPKFRKGWNGYAYVQMAPLEPERQERRTREAFECGSAPHSRVTSAPPKRGAAREA